jgi:hypothetical protein
MIAARVAAQQSLGGTAPQPRFANGPSRALYEWSDHVCDPTQDYHGIVGSYTFDINIAGEKISQFKTLSANKIAEPPGPLNAHRRSDGNQLARWNRAQPKHLIVHVFQGQSPR